MADTTDQPTTTSPGGLLSGREPMVLAVLLGALLLLRVSGLIWSQADLFFDEAQYWSWAQEPAFGYYSKPPVIAYAIWVTTALFGDAEWAVRLSSPLLHTVTAVLVYWLGQRLYDRQVGFWAAAGFAMLPAVSLSSLLISTDVPLLVCWAAGLLALERYLAARTWASAVLLGLAIGAGLNAKYAMIYLPACLILYSLLTRDRRWILAEPKTYLAFALGAALLIPNLLWNWQNGFATIAHTRDNANWGGPLLHPIKFAEFLGAQFGVFGPILFAALLVLAFNKKAWARDPSRFLLFFSVPIIAVIAMQALLSRAHANWAATAYVAGSVLVAAALVRIRWRNLLKITAVLHGLVALAVPVSASFAPTIGLPGGRLIYARVLGWQDLGTEIKKLAEERTEKTLIFAHRKYIAAMLYYMRRTPFRMTAWPPEAGPRDHFQLTRPYKPTDGPALVITPSPDADRIETQFTKVERLKPIPVPRAVSPSGALHVFAVSGVKTR